MKLVSFQDSYLTRPAFQTLLLLASFALYLPAGRSLSLRQTMLHAFDAYARNKQIVRDLNESFVRNVVRASALTHDGGNR